MAVTLQGSTLNNIHIGNSGGGAATFSGTSSQLTAGDGSAVTVGSGLSLSAGTLSSISMMPIQSISAASASVQITAENAGTWLNTSGPTISCNVSVGSSGKVMVFVSAYFYSASGQTTSFVSFDITGATVRPASVQQTAGMYAGRAASSSQFGQSACSQFIVEGLSPGDTTFAMKVMGLSDSVGKTLEFYNRTLIVTPL